MSDENSTMKEIRSTQPYIICPRCKNDNFVLFNSDRYSSRNIVCSQCREDLVRYGFFLADVQDEHEREEDIVKRYNLRTSEQHDIDDPITKNIAWNVLRAMVLMRDNYQCKCKCNKPDMGIMCSNGIEKLDIHHIKPRANGGTDDINNLITLCQDCHPKIQKRSWM